MVKQKIRTRLMVDTTPAEFNLANHVESAAKAVRFARDGNRELARFYGKDARQWFGYYQEELAARVSLEQRYRSVMTYLEKLLGRWARADFGRKDSLVEIWHYRSTWEAAQKAYDEARAAS